MDPSTQEARADQQDPYLSIDHVSIYVRDLDRSLRFYIDQLGFDLTFDARLQSGMRLVSVAPPHGTAVLRLIAPEPGSEQYQLIGRPTQVVLVTEDVVAKFREWSGRGVRFLRTPRLKRIKYDGSPVRRSPAPPPGDDKPLWGGVFARFEDIDGNSFALMSLDELTHALEAQRRAAAEKLEAERRVARELEIAREVQARLFPQTLPAVRTLDYAGVCIQARRVGGDYYDFLALSRERLGLVIGDIAGKGIAAALLMANLQANLRSQSAISADDPQLLLCTVNELFYANTGDSAYATLFFAVYEDRTQTLRYANCGHVCGLLLRPDNSLERLDSTCTVLGLFKEWGCSMEECRLVAGDTLLLYTDGVTESFDDAGEEFGEERLIAALRRGRELSPEALVGSVIDSVRQYSPNEQYDDITVIAARCRG